MSNPIYIDVKHQVYWLSYEYLRLHNIPKDSFMNWSKRDVCKRKYIDRRAYIDYDTIPEPSRAKLPGKDEIKKECRRQRTAKDEDLFFKLLKKAYGGIRSAYWRNRILKQYPDLQYRIDELMKFARRAAVFEEVLRIQSNLFKFADENKALFYAFNRIFPEAGYKYMSGFCRALDKAKKDGILSVSVNHSCLNHPEKRHTDEHELYVKVPMSNGKNFSRTQGYKIFSAACRDAGIKTLSFKWFCNFYIKNRNDIERGGKSKWNDENRNYAKLIQAENAGDQWQMDGWRIPIYCKEVDLDGKLKKFVTYILFAVMDAHSRKIIGWHISKTENTQVILKGLEMAIKETGTLPYEIVSDNHSFNKTNESRNLKDDFKALGTTWTVDSNPRRKVLIERGFEKLGSEYFKMEYGYIGEGVKTRNRYGLTAPELMDKYAKTDNLLTYDQLVVHVAYVIDKFNNGIYVNLGDTPNNRYEKSEKPNAITVDDFDRIQLFILKSDCLIRHGQITIKKGGHQYEYQLPAGYSEYNNQRVGVRYVNFDEIYLYELETDKKICSIKEKPSIHSSLANQTEKDKELLFKNSGRTKGIETQKRKRNEESFNGAIADNLDASERINKMTNSKDTIEEIRNNPDFKLKVLDQFGINADYVSGLPVADEVADSSLKPRKEKDIKHLYQTVGTMEKLTIDN